MQMTISFTGSRPYKLYGYHADIQYRRLMIAINDALNSLGELRDIDELTFLTGGAQGADQIAFDAVELYKHQHSTDDIHIYNVIYIPFAHQDIRWYETGYFGRTAYAARKCKADRIENVCTMTDKINQVSVKNPYLARNDLLVDDCDMLIAIAMSETIQSSRGTCYTIKYALSHGKKVMLLDADELTMKTITDINVK